MKFLTVIFLLISINAFASDYEYEVSNKNWAGVVVAEKASGKVHGYISRSWVLTKKNSVENPVIVTGSFYVKGMVRVTGTQENGTPVMEVLDITSMHNPRD